MGTITGNAFLWSRILKPPLLQCCRSQWWSTAQWQVTYLTFDVGKTRISFFFLRSCDRTS